MGEIYIMLFRNGTKQD